MKSKIILGLSVGLVIAGLVVLSLAETSLKNVAAMVLLVVAVGAGIRSGYLKGIKGEVLNKVTLVLSGGVVLAGLLIWYSGWTRLEYVVGMALLLLAVFTGFWACYEIGRAGAEAVGEA